MHDLILHDAVLQMLYSFMRWIETNLKAYKPYGGHPPSFWCRYPLFTAVNQLPGRAGSGACHNPTPNITLLLFHFLSDSTSSHHSPFISASFLTPLPPITFLLFTSFPTLLSLWLHFSHALWLHFPTLFSYYIRLRAYVSIPLEWLLVVLWFWVRVRSFPELYSKSSTLLTLFCFLTFCLLNFHFPTLCFSSLNHSYLSFIFPIFISGSSASFIASSGKGLDRSPHCQNTCGTLITNPTAFKSYCLRLNQWYMV